MQQKINLQRTFSKDVCRHSMGENRPLSFSIMVVSKAARAAFIERLTFWALEFLGGRHLGEVAVFGCKEEKQSVSSLVVAYRNDFFACFASLFFFRFNVMYTLLKSVVSKKN